MHLNRPLFASLTAAVFVLALGTAPANAEAKPSIAVSEHAVAADQAAVVVSPAVSPAVRGAESTIQARIATHVQTHGASHTFGTWADPASGKVVIVTDAPSTVVSGLVDGYGPQLVEVRGKAVSDTFSRRDDIAPYWGGAGLLTSVGGNCTTGYMVRSFITGAFFMVTAGHCYNNGQNAVTEIGSRVVGTATDNGLSSPVGNIDTVLLDGQSYSPFVYTGGVDSSTAAHVASAGNPVVGFNDYCFSGRTTGETCGRTVTSVTAQVCTVDTGCKSPVIAFTGGAQGGDSGAPFYANSVAAPDKHIRGHVIASDGSTVSFAEMWTRVASWHGVSIVI